MAFFVVSIFLLNIVALGAEAAIADVIVPVSTKRITDLKELSPRERHELKPTQESIANFFVRSVQTLPDNKKQVEWCVATTSSEKSQAYHVRMTSIKPFDGPPYTIPEDILEPKENETLRLSADKKIVSADFTTHRGKDGFCAKTTEGPATPVGRMMILDVWTDTNRSVAKVGATQEIHTKWKEFSVFTGNDATPICQAVKDTKANRCRLEAVRVKLIDTIPLGMVNAQFVAEKSQLPPATLKAGEQKEVKITMKNTGTSTWMKTGTNPYVLAAKNPQRDNRRWGISRVELPVDSVKPGEEVTFTFTIKAPQKAGVYDFQWQMYQVPVQYFGQIAPSPVVKITVTQPQITMTPSKTTVAHGEAFTVSWNVPDGVKTSERDWITLVNPGVAYTVEDWFYTDGIHTGAHTLNAQTAAGSPLTPGTYEIRYYHDDGTADTDIMARGPQITVT